jgi:hypothetical protein
MFILLPPGNFSDNNDMIKRTLTPTTVVETIIQPVLLQITCGAELSYIYEQWIAEVWVFLVYGTADQVVCIS